MRAENVLTKKTAWNQVLPGLVIVVNTFTWFILIGNLFPQIVDELQMSTLEMLLTLGLYFFSTSISAFFGSRVRSNALLNAWLLMGTIASTLLWVIDASLPLSAYATALLLGASVGVGLPACLTYFTDLTKIENRGRLAGIAYVAISLSVLIFSIGMTSLSYASTVLVLVILRASGLVAFILIAKKALYKKEQAVCSYQNILGQRSLILYLLPWIMFCLINWLERPIVENLFGQEIVAISLLAELLIGGLSAFITSVLSDRIGRKRMIVGGFVMLGLGYAFLGLFHDALIAWYTYIILDGVAWGIFAVFFFIIIWADLAETLPKERFYFIGGLPYLLAGFLSVLVKPIASVILPTTSFSLASFFLFLAVIPLMYAPETLPEKTIKERELKSYIEKAKKEKEKHA
jgi:MFS family permease